MKTIMEKGKPTMYVYESKGVSDIVYCNCLFQICLCDNCNFY